MVYRIILHVSWLFSIVLFFSQPLHVDYNFSLYTLIVCVYLLSIISYYKIKKKRNYFDFDTIFIAFCSIEHFMVGFFLDSEELTRILAFEIDRSLVIKGALLSMLGLVSYMEGSIHEKDYKTDKLDFRVSKGYERIRIEQVFYIYCLTYLVYIYFGGLSFYKAQYMEGIGSMDVGGIVFQAQALFVTFSLIFLAVTFHKYLFYKTFPRQNKIYSIIILLTILPIALVGNRTVFSYILIPFLICYFTYIYPLNIKKTVVIGACGVLAMFAIQRLRQGISDLRFNSVVTVFSDVISPGKMLYASLEYVDKYGLNWGETMMPPIIAIIPGLSKLLGEDTVVGSAEVLTNYMTPAGQYWGGMGTTIIADVYISFGGIGVIVFFYCLGMFVHKRWKNSMTNLLVEISLASSCIFMARSSFFLPMRSIIWSLLFCAILNTINNRKL